MNPQSMGRMIAWFLGHAASDASWPTRITKLFSFFADGKAVMKECITAHCEVAQMFVRRLGFGAVTEQTVRYTYEQWDGRGVAYGLRQAETPLAARIIHLAQAIEVAHSFGGPSAALALVRERRGTDFDPDLVDTLAALARDGTVWEALDQESVQPIMQDFAPLSARRAIAEIEVDTVCEALADFADIKTRRSWNYSPSVAALAADVGRKLGLDDTQVTELRRAGLVHDVGKAAVPCAILLKEPQLNVDERERLQLHPYYSERILERVPQLAPLTSIVGAHHERVDGNGYHRRLSGAQIPLAARILALAQVYALELQTLGAGADLQEALRAIRPAVGTQLDPECYEALAGTAGSRAGMHQRPARDPRAGNLTAREVEVLRQVGTGLSNREIAKALVISEKTVESHLEHIYAKLDVTCRTAAVVFGVQNGLIQPAL